MNILVGYEAILFPYSAELPTKSVSVSKGLLSSYFIAPPSLIAILLMNYVFSNVKVTPSISFLKWIAPPLYFVAQLLLKIQFSITVVADSINKAPPDYALFSENTQLDTTSYDLIYESIWIAPPLASAIMLWNKQS